MVDSGNVLNPFLVTTATISSVFHIIGFFLLLLVRYEPANQRLITINLSVTECFFSMFHIAVYTGLMADCNKNRDCLAIDDSVTVLLLMANKLTMVHLILDRLLAIKLHLKYPLYFTQKLVKKMAISIWVISVVYSMIVGIVWKLEISRFVLDGLYYVLVATDALITITAILTYFHLYKKVRDIRRKDRSASVTVTSLPLKDMSKVSMRKFLVPCLMILSYLLFNCTSTGILVAKDYYESKMVLLSDIAHLLLFIGWISDACIYIIYQRSIRKHLFVILKCCCRVRMKKKQSVTPPSVSVITGNSRLRPLNSLQPIVP